MEEEIATRFWCHRCSQTVNPVMEAEIKCPFCQGGFIEEMQDSNDSSDVRSNNSLWAPVLVELMGDHIPVRRGVGRNRSFDFSEFNQNDIVSENSETGRETDMDWQLQEVLRRRRRHSAAVLQLLQGIRAGLTLQSESNGGDDNNQERVIFINPFNQTITVRNSGDMESVPGGSLGDYFIGPGFEMLLQRLAENDPNRYGTPPAKKEAVEALATVKIEETLQCSVCLDDFEIGTEAKQMPCKHKFHGDCLFPWLELHSSCPVCRYQLPTDEPKTESASTATSENNNNNNNDDDNNGGINTSATSRLETGSSNRNQSREEEQEEENENENEGNGSGFSIPWPFSTLFSWSQESNASRDAS